MKISDKDYLFMSILITTGIPVPGYLQPVLWWTCYILLYTCYIYIVCIYTAYTLIIVFQDPLWFQEQRCLFWSINNQLQEKWGTKQTFKWYTVKKNDEFVYLPKLLKAVAFHKYVLFLTRISPYFTNSNIPVSEYPLVLQMKT